MAECILRDMSQDDQREICILVAQENAMRFYRDLLKNLVSKNSLTSFKSYQVKETFVRTNANNMERVWSILPIKPSSGNQITDL